MKEENDILHITNKKNIGSHGLRQDTFKLQTMTALNKSFCWDLKK